MAAAHLDAVARRLADVRGSRRRLIAVAAALLAGGTPAAGRAANRSKVRRRCREHGGVYLRHGACHCGQTCMSATPCGRHPGCVCRATADGTGFCAGLMEASFGCSATSDCQSGFTCTVEFGCAAPGLACATGADCHAINPDLGCIDGFCQSTYCSNPCG
jgi:hypothetical protein